MRVLLTGASGFLGGHLLDRLLAAGHSVRCLVRSSSPRRNLVGRPVEIAEGDLTEPASLAPAVADREWVFHCAADYRFWARDPRTIYATNVGGTRDLLAACAHAGVRRVVHTSSVGALGLAPDGRAADESTPVTLADLVGHYKRSKYLAERVAEEWARRGLDVVIVNPSTPVGEGDLKPTATGRMVLDFLNRRVPAYVDTGLNLIDVRDVAAGHLLAAERGTTGERYILGNRNLSLREIYGILGELAGLAAPRIEVPHWLPIAYAATTTAWARLTGRPPAIPLESARLSRHRMYFDAAKAVRELGLPQTPIEEALARAVAWFRDNGYARR